MAEQSLTHPTDLRTAPTGSTKPRFRKTASFQENLIRTLATLTVLAGLVVVLFPIFWMLSMSLKSELEVFKMPPVWIPATPQWSNYLSH